MIPFVLRTDIETRPRHHAGSNRWVSRFFTLAASVIVISFHLVWVLSASDTAPFQAVPAAHGSVPDVFYLGEMHDDAAADYSRDIRLLRSPVLFSLPTGVGFSGPLLGKANAGQAPYFAERPAEFLRVPGESFGARDYGETVRTLDELSRAARSLVLPDVDRMAEDAFGGIPSDRRLLMYWMDRPAGENTVSPATKELDWAGTEPWDAVFCVIFDQDGWVSHVLMEKPSPSKDINDRLLHMIRSLDLNTPTMFGQSRLAVKFVPATTAAEDARGG